MSHEIVSRIVAALSDNGSTVETEEWLFAFDSDNGPGWHGLGKGTPGMTLDDAATWCEFTRTVACEPLYFADGSRYVGKSGVRDSAGRTLGVVGDGYSVHQDTDLVALAQSYVEAGCRFDTAGMLRGGSTIFLSLSINGSEFDVRPGDPVRTNLMLAQSHDGSLAVVQGYTDVRVVCNNTLGQALRERGSERRSVKHRGRVVSRSEEARDELRAMLDAQRARVQVYRTLANVQNVTEAEIKSFLAAVFGKDEGRAGGPCDRVRLAFHAGAGNGKGSAWDLYNGVTDATRWSLGNVMADDAKGDREGRALSKMLLGTGPAMSGAALRAALDLAKARGVNVAAR